MHKHYSQLLLSHTSENNKYIIFLGDSYTWGQGLWLPFWLEKKPEIFEYFYKNTDEAETHLEWLQQQPFVDDDDIILKDSLSFTNIVAKELNRNCYKKIDNGGNNLVNVSFLKEFEENRIMSDDVIVIYQFTSAGRDEFEEITDEEFQLYCTNNINLKKILKNKIKTVFKTINDSIENIEKNLGWKCFYLDWMGDFCDFLPDKFIKIGDDYHFYDLITNSHISIEYKDKQFKDYHLNKQGNQIIADSILDHINKFG